MQDELEERTDRAIGNFKQSLSKIRTGRIQPSILDSVKINYYGSDVPISQVSAITSKDATTLMVKPWEKNMYMEIEKALQISDLNINPINSGDCILIPFPPATQERRLELVKQLKSLAEQAKIGIRQIRRDYNEAVKANKELSKDEQHDNQEMIQKQIDKSVSEIEDIISRKEKDIMTV